MSKKKKNSHKNREGIVYSTDPDFSYFDGLKALQSTLPNEEQQLLVRIERKQRGGKVVTLVEGFVGTTEDVKSLSKLLRSKCGVGGSQKDNQIIVQGDLKQKVADILRAEGYGVKISG